MNIVNVVRWILVRLFLRSDDERRLEHRRRPIPLVKHDRAHQGHLQAGCDVPLGLRNLSIFP
jgi:hypothetical protein